MTRMAERIRKLREITGGAVECGCVCDEVALLIYTLVKFYRPELVIQTGHLWGKSAVVILEALTDGGPAWGNLGARAHIEFMYFVDTHRPLQVPIPLFISIDPQDGAVPNFDAGIDYLIETYGESFKYWKMTSQHYFAVTSAPHQRFMAFVDGDHSPAGVEFDVRSFAVLGAEVIVLDDTLWIPHIEAIGRRLASELGYDFTHWPLYNGVAVLTRRERA